MKGNVMIFVVACRSSDVSGDLKFGTQDYLGLGVMRRTSVQIQITASDRIPRKQ